MGGPTAQADVISGVPSEGVERLWPAVEPILARVVGPEGRFSTADVLAAIKSRRMQLWIGGRPLSSAAVTEILIYPRRKTCRVIFAAGDARLIAGGLPLLERWARGMGCDGLEIVTERDGWARLLPGFERKFTIMRKELL